MYVTEDFYKNDYAGQEISSEKLIRYIKRAERDVDRLTRFRIENFDSKPDKIKELIRNAVCSQVEFIDANGETSTSFKDDGPFSIGGYSEGSQQVKSQEGKPLIAQSTLDFLYPTGYLYNGVDYY